MLKLLFIPTGNVFTLPDAEAMRIMKADRGNNYKILDAGFQEETQETINQEEVVEIVENLEETAKQIEEQDNVKELVKQPKENPKLPKVKEDTLDPKNLTKEQLVGMLKRLELKGSIKESKPVLVQRLKDAGIL